MRPFFSDTQAWGSCKNNFTFSHLRFTPPSAAPQSRNPQRRLGYVCGFAQSVATKSGANLSAISAKLFLHDLSSLRIVEEKKGTEFVGRR